MPQWLQGHQELFYWLTGASVALLLASLVALPIVLVRLPANYFQEGSRHREQPVWLRVVRNIVGWLIIVIGLAMLVLPGQGLLMVLFGVMLADFPGKTRLEKWIISRKKVLSSANWIRGKFGKQPLTV